MLASETEMRRGDEIAIQGKQGAALGKYMALKRLAYCGHF
jgi:hypothetical protein